MKKFILSYAVLLILPFLAYAAEYTLIAPIPGPDGAKTATNFASYLQALFPFLLSVAAGLAFVMIVIGGIFYMTSAGNPAAISSARDRIKAAVIGLLIAVSSYVIINAINPKLLTLDIAGSIPPIPSGGGGCTEGGDGYPRSVCEKQLAEPPEGTSIDLNEKNGLCAPTSQFNQFINEASEIYGIPAARIRAIIMVESRGDPRAVSDDNDGGHSYGLMQIRPDTARTLDSSLAGKSDREVIEKLQDPRYNITKQGTKYYKQLKDKYGSNDLASAAYNGGPVANYPSVNCASEGVRRWQCKWDNNEHTIPNARPGHPGYGHTRTYVPKVANLESKIVAGACE